MAFLTKAVSFLTPGTPKFLLTQSRFIKTITANINSDSLIIEGITEDVSELGSILKREKNFCPECSLNLNIKHTDVLILKQYVRSDGCMLPRRITGLCKQQQRRIGTMVAMAQKAGLMPNLTPANSKKDPKKRYQWKKYNKYFDETTIKPCRY